MSFKVKKPDPIWVRKGYSSKVKFKEDDIQMVPLATLNMYLAVVEPLAAKYKKTMAELDQFTLDVDKLIEDHNKERTALDLVKEYVLMEAENINSDIEHKGMLKPALEYFQEPEG